jgi:hypothetical protein
VVESHRHSAVKLLRQIPAIGPIRAALLVALLQTPHRFRTKRFQTRLASSPSADEPHRDGKQPEQNLSSESGARLQQWAGSRDNNLLVLLRLRQSYSDQVSPGIPTLLAFVFFALLAFLALAVAKTAVSGRQLLMAASVWFVAVLAWNTLGPSSFFLNFGKRNRSKIALAFAFGWFYQLFIFGWLSPLAVGIHRVTER